MDRPSLDQLIDAADDLRKQIKEEGPARPLWDKWECRGCGGLFLLRPAPEAPAPIGCPYCGADSPEKLWKVMLCD